MLGRTVVYHHPDEGPMAMLVTRIQEDGTLNGHVFTDGARVDQHVQGTVMSQTPEPGTCTLPEGEGDGPSAETVGNALASAQIAAGEAQIAADAAKADAHKADLAADRSLRHAKRAEEAAEAAASE